MSTSRAEITGASALSVRVTCPLPERSRFPSRGSPYCNGTQQERENWSLIGGGHGIHWPDLNEDISVESLLTGQRSRESDSSLRKWIERRGIRQRSN